MSVYFLTLLLASSIILVKPESCPSVCTCETAALSDLPINSVLIKSQQNKPGEHLPSYQTRNEVLDETDEHEAEHSLGEEKLKAATCVLKPADNLALFLSLPSDIQVLTVLQGPGTGNITLEEAYLQNLQNLVVLEIHGFPHGHEVLHLRNNALKHLKHLRYLNLQHIHLLGDRGLGNRPVPPAGVQFMDSNIIQFTKPGVEDNSIPEAIQYIPDQTEGDIVPYSVYRDQQERAGLSCFAGLHSLKFMRAYQCNIKEVHWEMFDGLKNLEYLSLEGNKIPFFHEFSFYGTPNLKYLIISHNKLLSVQSTDLAGLLKLEVLDLSYNNISHLSELSLPPLPLLVTADFHHNPLELILPNTFQIMNNTEQLYIGKKHVNLEIRHNTFLGLDKLRKLSVTGINLDVLERDHLTGMPHLRELKIEGTIHELAFDAFVEVSKIQELILKQCSIHKISMDAFFGLYGLVYLDLSHNELETLPPSLFDQQHSLKEINLYNNKLKTLPQGLFLHTAAKLIRLDKNPWHCTCLMDEWQPSQINKVKVKVIDNSMCQTRYDKGSMCKVRYMYHYMYEQSVSPRCATPVRFSGWSVFHLLRKHLRCDPKIYKHHTHLHGENPLKINLHSEEKMATDRNITNSHIQPNSNISTAVSSEYVTNVQTNSERFTAVSNFSTIALRSSTIPSDESKTLQKEQITMSIPRSTSRTTEVQDNVLDLINSPDVNQYMWTRRDKEKYKLLQQKQDRLLKKANSTLAYKDKYAPGSFKVNTNVPYKAKKTTETQKKWEVKMEDTILRRLNRVQGNTL